MLYIIVVRLINNCFEYCCEFYCASEIYTLTGVLETEMYTLTGVLETEMYTLTGALETEMYTLTGALETVRLLYRCDKCSTSNK
jgi:hypothetical protein